MYDVLAPSRYFVSFFKNHFHTNKISLITYSHLVYINGVMLSYMEAKIHH